MNSWKFEKKTIVLALILVVVASSFGVTAFAKKLDEPNPFEAIWNAITALEQRVTVIEEKPSPLTLSYYTESHPDEVEATLIPFGPDINEKLVELIFTPPSPVHTLWQVQVDYESREFCGYFYNVYIKISDNEGNLLAESDKTHMNAEYMQFSTSNLEVNPFTARNCESYKVEVWVYCAGWEFTPSIRNVDVTFAVFD